MRICTFCGHADASDEILPALNDAILDMINEKGVTEFYIGNHGRFDSMVKRVLKDVRESYSEIEFYTVLAYMPEKPVPEITIYPDGIENVPRRFAITYRNRWMVEHSDYLIAYVRRGYGGASQTLKFAKNRCLKIVEI